MHPGRKLAICGVGYSPVSRKSGLSILQHALLASKAAIEDAGLKPTDVDGLAQYGFPYEMVTTWDVSESLGIGDLQWYCDMVATGPAGIAGVLDACAAVASGSCEVALAYRTVTVAGGHSAGRAPQTHAGGPAQFSVPYGNFAATQWIAMYMQRHMHVYGTKPEHFGALAVAQREYAVHNERAIMRKPITMEDYLAARYISDPLRLLDCDLPVDGAGAVIVTTLDRAKYLRKKPIQIDAWALGTGGRPDWFQWPDMTTMGTHIAAKNMWRRSQFKPSDVHTANLYDGFTIITFNWLEALGFVKPGEAGPFVAAGQTRLGGKLPLNTNGGMLNIGRVHGISHVIEGVEQLRGESGQRQVKNAKIAVAANGGGPMAGCLVMFTD
ncbi:MAG: thiolase family protein [Chloroflexi bacterium]|nr:thiolase family protein [Chloroflexota bacterium]